MADRRIDHACLARAPGRIDAGAAARDLLGAHAKQARRDRRRCRGVADAHLAEDQEIRLIDRRARDRALAGLEGENQLRRRERGLGAEIARAAPRLVDDDIRHRLLRQRAGVDDLQTRTELARQHGDRGAAGGEIGHHGDGDGLRIGRHALRDDAVVAGEDDDRHARGTRLLGRLQAGKLDRELLEPAERAGRLRQLRLPRNRGVAMDCGEPGTVLGHPFGKHAAQRLRLRM